MRVSLMVLFTMGAVLSGCSNEGTESPLASGTATSATSTTAHAPSEPSGETGLTPAGPLQGNWRVVRAGDPADGALMLLHLFHDGDRLEGSYLLHQPFCAIDMPLPVPSAEDCEFTGLSEDIAGGDVTDDTATVIIRPGADEADHRLTFSAQSGEGVYEAPGGGLIVPIRVARAPD